MPWSIPVSRSTTAQATAPSTLCTTSLHASSIFVIRLLLCGSSAMAGGAGFARLCASAAKDGTFALVVNEGGRTLALLVVMEDALGGGGTLRLRTGGVAEYSDDWAAGDGRRLGRLDETGNAISKLDSDSAPFSSIWRRRRAGAPRN